MNICHAKFPRGMLCYDIFIQVHGLTHIYVREKRSGVSTIGTVVKHEAAALVQASMRQIYLLSRALENNYKK
jgi:hypothetical protein